EHVQRLAPCSLLLVVDLAQVQHRPLHGPGTRQPAILHHAEVAVSLAILFSLSAAQKHGSSRMPEVEPKEKRVGLHPGLFRPFSDGRCCRQTKYSSAEPQKLIEVRKSG